MVAFRRSGLLPFATYPESRGYCEGKVRWPGYCWGRSAQHQEFRYKRLQSFNKGLESLLKGEITVHGLANPLVVVQHLIILDSVVRIGHGDVAVVITVDIVPVVGVE